MTPRKAIEQAMVDYKKWMLVVGLVGCCLAGCRPSVESSTTDKPKTQAIKAPEHTQLGKLAVAIANAHAGESGFLLLDHGNDALSWRTILADAAQQTIDAQYFMWNDDDAGKIMMQRLLAAAERGVRVRVMIDDSLIGSDPEYLAVFGAHPNIELRLYKPFGPKAKSEAMRWIDYLADLRVLNRRMHNKSFVVDGSMAIVGGRNIGNEYFDYRGPFVFRSRDLLAVGPIVGKTETAFDLYWNSDWTVPIEQVVSVVPDLQSAQPIWKQLDQFAADPDHYPAGFDHQPDTIEEEMARLESNLLWGKAKLLVDAVPEKNGQPQTSAELDSTGIALRQVVDHSSEKIHIQSAYLILLDGGFEAIEQAISRGVNVKLATNSMASNNHLTAFVGYRKQRHRMLETGAELFEMRPDAKSLRTLFTDTQLEEYKPTFGLHAKTMVFDRKITFVGSFNLDPRSVNLNSEMGFLVESPLLAEAVAASIENDIAPGNSWQVIIQSDGQIAWITTENGLVKTESITEPMTSKERRAEAELLSVVPDDSEL